MKKRKPYSVEYTEDNPAYEGIDWLDKLLIIACIILSISIYVMW